MTMPSSSLLWLHVLDVRSPQVLKEFSVYAIPAFPGDELPCYTH